MKISMLLLKKEFVDEISKEAYLKACGWAATHIVSKVEAGDIFWNITKKKDASLPTFVLEVHTMIDAEQHQESFCGACKEFHQSFFINQETNCNSCRYLAFTKQIDHRLAIKKEFNKDKMGL